MKIKTVLDEPRTGAIDYDIVCPIALKQIDDAIEKHKGTFTRIELTAMSMLALIGDANLNMDTNAQGSQIYLGKYKGIDVFMTKKEVK